MSDLSDYNLFLFEKYETNIDDVGGKRRYCWNILQWSKNDFKSKNNTKVLVFHTLKKGKHLQSIFSMSMIITMSNTFV